jgi:xylulokinase
MVYIGLDVGTTGSKATAVDVNGGILASAYGEYPTLRQNEGWAEIDPVSVWETVKTVLGKAAASVGPSVRAIAVASLGESFVLMGKDGRVLVNSMLYSDIRGTEEVADIRRTIGEEELFGITGMPLNAMYTLNKLLWIRGHDPKTLDNTEKIFLFGDFIYYMLSGESAIDYSLASRTLLFDFKRLAWSQKVMDLFGMDPGKFSRPVAPGAVIGHVGSKTASMLGLPPNVALVAGGHDQVCAALGAGVTAKGGCVDGIGTSECITALLDGYEKSTFMQKNNFCIEPYAIKGEYATLAFNVSGAATLRWFRDTFEDARLKQGPFDASIYTYLEKLTTDKPTDLYVLPYFAGSGTPYMDPYASGAILGLRLHTTKGEIYKALMEGLCYEMRMNAELLSAVGIRLTSLTCVGGGARSDRLLQVKADITGLPVRRLKAEECGTIGLAILCSAALGEDSSIAEAAKRLVHVEREFHPDPEYHAIYTEKYGTYKELYPRITRTLFGK